MADKTTILKTTQKLMAKGQVDKAINLWIEYVDKNKDANIFNTIGDLYLKIHDKKNASDWFHKAAAIFRSEGFYQKSIAIYRKALNIDPSDPAALLALGELNEEKGLVPDAIKFYLATIDAFNKKGKKGEVLTIYQKILGVAPSNLPLRTKIVEYFVKEGLNEDASKELIYIARLYEERGESEKAVENFNRATLLFPKNKDAYLSMSKLYFTLNKKEEAINILNKALDAFPDDADFKVQIVDQFVKDGRFDEAKEILKQLTEKDPDNIGIKEQIANIHMLKGNLEKAWSIYSSIIDELHLIKRPEQLIGTLKNLYEQDPVAVGKKLAYLYKESEDKASAFAEFIKVGTILKDSGMTDEALNIFNEAKHLDPDNEEVDQAIAELNKEVGIEEAATVAEKSTDEALTDVEIFLRYGQTEQAAKILESLKAKEPENQEVHKKLKSLYIEIGEKELAVTECIILSGLYEKEGNSEMKEQLLNEAFEIDPNDPRLMERASDSVQGESALASTGLEDLEETTEVDAEPFAETSAEPVTTSVSERVGSETPDTYEEELSEADFYFRQGLIEEAKKIYEKLLSITPESEDIKEKIGVINSMSASVPPDDVSLEETSVEAFTEFEAPVEESAGLDGSVEEEMVSSAAEETFGGLLQEEAETLSAEEIPEPTLENDVLEIFEEFKKGIETELDEEDSETHYNLGIAYKEMGLIDDAIKEFQTANKDPRRAIQSSSMLGICYIEKGLYHLAIEALQKALSNITEKDTSYWGTKYDLADAHEKNGNIQEAIDLYTEIYSNDSKFRNVDERLNRLTGEVSKDSVKESSTSAIKKKKKDRISYI